MTCGLNHAAAPSHDAGQCVTVARACVAAHGGRGAAPHCDTEGERRLMLLLLVAGALLAILGATVVVLVPDASAAGLVLCFGGVVLTRSPTPHPVRGGYAGPAEHDTRQVQHGARP